MARVLRLEGGLGAVGSASNFPDISLFPKILSPKSFGNLRNYKIQSLLY